MTAFRPGEIVDIAIKGVRVVGHPSAPLVRIADEHGATFDMPPQAAVTRVVPDRWPPMVGDVWGDKNGGHWFAVRFGRELCLMPGRMDDPWVEYKKSPDGLLAELGPLILVCRETEEPPF